MSSQDRPLPVTTAVRAGGRTLVPEHPQNRRCALTCSPVHDDCAAYATRLRATPDPALASAG